MAVKATQKFHQLPKQSHKFNRLAIINAGSDLTETTVATADEFRYPIPLGCRVDDVLIDVRKLLVDLSDAGFNDVTVQVGDSGGAAAFIAAMQVNQNGGGAAIMKSMDAAAVAPKVYAAPDYIRVTVTPMAAKKLSDIDYGEIRVYVSLRKTGELG